MWLALPSPSGNPTTRLVPTSRMISSAIAPGSENSFGIKCKPRRGWHGRCVESDASAADLKFLQRLPQDRVRKFNSKSRHWEYLFAGAPLLPKFVPEDAATYHELRSRGTGRRQL